MGHYQASATNFQNFSLTVENRKIGDLIYKKWYSFSAEIAMPNGSIYQLEPKGFWDSKVELKDDTQVLLAFNMGWKGIIIKTFFKGKEETLLLTLKGLLSNKYILLNTDNKELMVAEADFKWNKFSYNYIIETSPQFDNLDKKELLILTILHCINYYMTMISGT